MGHEIRSDCGHLQTNGPPFILLFQITLSYVITTNTFAPENSVPVAHPPRHIGCSTSAQRLHIDRPKYGAESAEPVSDRGAGAATLSAIRW